MLVNLRCKCCGTLLEQVKPNTQFCSECARIRKNRQAYDSRKRIAEENVRKQHGTQDSMKDIRRIANEAAKLGMSYGEYVQKKGL